MPVKAFSPPRSYPHPHLNRTYLSSNALLSGKRLLSDVISPFSLGRGARETYLRSFRRPGRSSLMAMLATLATLTRQILRACLSPAIRNETLQAGVSCATKGSAPSGAPRIGLHFTTARQSRTLYARVPAIPRIAEVLSSPPFTSLTADLFLPHRAPPRKSKHRGRGNHPHISNV